MADRLPQYPMVPPFNQNMLQQQQQLPQAQQQPPLDTQAVSTFANQDLGRAWQQQQMHNPQATDMQSPQLRERMGELLRSRQPHMGQQFGLASQQMGGNPQHSPFHDPSATQRTQSHLQPKFPNIGIPNSGQMQQSRNQLAFAGPNSGHLTRMELMGMAPGHQQAQNAQLNFAPRMPPGMQQPQPTPPSLNLQAGQSQTQQGEPFSSPAVPSADGIRRSPSHPIHPSGAAGNQPLNVPNPAGVPAGRRLMNFQELRERAQQLQAYITQQETLLGQLGNHRTGMSDAEYFSEGQRVATELKACKEMMGKILHMMSQSAPQQIFNPTHPQSTGPNMEGSMQQQQQQHQQQHQTSAMLIGANQPQWTLPNGSQPPQPQPSGFVSAQMGQATTLQSTPSLSIQASPSQGHTQPTHSQAQNAIPRPGPTPQLQPGQLPPQVAPSPNASHQYSFQMPANGNAHIRNDQVPQGPLNPLQMSLVGLEKEPFDKLYRAFCHSKNLQPDQRLLSIDSRPIDLNLLHKCVISEGGFTNIHQKELWAVIGARMGFVQFPGSETEPARSGPGVAQHLAHVYKEYLLTFDNMYIHSCMEKQRKLQVAGAAPSSDTPTAARAIQNAHEMQAIIMLANSSVNELRAKGVPLNMIKYIEDNREQLQNSAKMQTNWKGNILGVKSSSGQPGTSQEQPQDRVHHVNSTPFASQQNLNVPGALPQPPVPRPGAFIQQQQPTPPASLVGLHNSETHYPRPSQTSPMNGLTQSLPPRIKSVPQEQWHAASMFIMRVKQDFMTRTIPHMAAKVIADNHKLEYGRVFERLQLSIMELEPRLPLFCLLVKQEDLLRRVIAIISTVQHQRNLLNAPTPKYIIDFPTLQAMVHQMQQAHDAFQQALNTVVRNQQLTTTPAAQPVTLNVQHQPRPPMPQPPPPVSVPQLIPPQSARTTPMTPIQAPKKKPPPARAGTSAVLTPTSLPAAASTPTPSPGPAATTPVANAQTPTHTVSSPQGSRSPKTKSTPKPKAATPAKRKASKSIPAPEVPPAAPISTKRPREEEAPVTVVAEPAADSPPKRAKTEVEASTPESETLAKKREEVDNIQSDEDAAAFFERWLNADGQTNEDIVATLATLLQGCPNVPGLETSTTDGPSTSAPPPPPPPPPQGPAEQFMEFFDFSSFGTLADDDNASKPPTPELMPSSSANPSPESGSEADAAGHHANADPRTDDSSADSSDFLRLGPWKEIDGGESAYYQPLEWKWDSSMPSAEQPWAIFTS